VDLASISLAALVVTVVLSCTTTVNPGVVAIVFAWIIGVGLHPADGTPIGLKGVIAGFPSELFLTLAGVTLLFAQAQANGTLERVAQAAVRCCRGNAGMVPVAFFGLALGLASIGAGNIAAAALVGPMAMAVAERAKIPAFLMTIMVAHGAVAGALSPVAPTGIIASELMGRMGMSGHETRFYLANLLANAAVAFAGYAAFGGLVLFRRRADAPAEESDSSARVLQARHVLTLAVIAALVVGVVGFGVQVGMAAFAGAALLTLAGAADEKAAIRAMPWGVMLMVCGVTVLTALLEKTGGLDLFTTILGKLATQRTVAGVIAFVTGLVSVYSSTSGVVLPAFLPGVPGLVEKLGGDPLAIASSILVGGHLVDVSPLSTIGALCVAGAGASEDRRLLFNRVLAWGLAMSVVGAVICQLAFGGSAMNRPVEGAGPGLAARVAGLRPTAVNRVLAEARLLQAEGRDLVSLMRGQPDTPTPGHIVEAAIKALRDGRTGYPDNRGEPGLRVAVAEALRRDHGLAYNPDREILVTDGATLGVSTALAALVGPGDDVLRPDPAYDAYDSPIALWGARPVPIAATLRAGRFAFGRDDLERAATAAARAVLINSPWNPTGTVLTPDELRAVVDFAAGRNLVILSDEIYESLTYDGRRATSTAAISADAKGRGVVVNSLSKTYAMTGWRVGYVAGPADLIAAMTLVLQQSSRGPATFVQDAAACALSSDQACVRAMAAEYEARRDLVVDRLRGIPGVSPVVPEGGLFILVDVRGLGRPSDDVRSHLLRESGVVVIHGAAYGACGEGTIRVSFAAGGPTLERGLERLREGLLRLSDQRP
jgi:aspartate/methionine/tyrosine aminotransferase/di/tricarboxylate transporter